MTEELAQGEQLAVKMQEFVAVAERAAPPSTVDPLLAVRQGRATVRRRRWTVAAAVGAVLLASGSFAVLQGGSGTGAAPVGPVDVRPSLAPSPTSNGLPPGYALPTGGSSAVPVEGRTVLTVPGRFGWLPDSVTGVEYRSGSTGVDVVAGGGVAEGRRFALSAFPVGVTPGVDALVAAGDGVRVDAPPVNGQEAYWVSSTDPGYAAAMNQLRFRAPDGRWFQLDSSGLTDQERTELPLRIAAGVVVGPYTPPMPLALSSLPADALVSYAELYLPVRPDGRWRASVNFQEQGSHYLMISVEPDPPEAVPSGEPIESNYPHACAAANGARWCVNSLQPVAGSPVGDPAAWLARVVARGADPAGWSVDVLP
ncbi:hypothetical protein [Streptomyces sp. TLI_171]|uniref:hypothetical protein n=1 Tax=Streptomyces sp. TLI_171 TaxID=1938859 RepID=UPI000C18811C|nr:hypothetical protein [Streptomyces sp. TLI_171]RKE19339.1 hypothetical protein BX266_2661 [Streptomyces sp. TLI_171]